MKNNYKIFTKNKKAKVWFPLDKQPAFSDLITACKKLGALELKLKLKAGAIGCKSCGYDVDYEDEILKVAKCKACARIGEPCDHFFTANEIYRIIDTKAEELSDNLCDKLFFNLK